MSHRTALLVVDVQMGAFDGALCPVIAGAESLLGKLAALIDAARNAGVEIIFIQHCAAAGEVFEEGSARWQIHPRVSPASGEQVVTKYQSSAFEGTRLHEELQSSRTGSLVICGLQSEHCVSNTALAAIDLGYSVTLAQDAHSTWPDAGLTAAQWVERQNDQLSQAGASIRTTRMLIEAFTADDHGHAGQRAPGR